ncbi:putative pilin/flagellin [Halapricum desulfuricans]|uniref:Putative pilin/flagellin n=1 Tax=Halapricum desulfuricans TaxID=2841257 RepID=A0A897NKG6_9EURY|nr:putative pilin/flagellin [Halapricum desulfuricans]
MIAIVVGVAALSVMMTIIDDVGTVGEEELSANPSEEVLTGNGAQVGVTVTDETGQGIPNATVYLKSGTAKLDVSDKTFDGTNYNGATKNDIKINPVSDIDWRPGQESGTIEVHIKPPGDGNYKDDQVDKITVLNPNV